MGGSWNGLAGDRIDVDCKQTLREGRRTLYDFTRGVHHKGPAVEDQFVLAAEQIDVDDRKPCGAHTIPHHAFASLLKAERIRRTIDDYDELRACLLRGDRGIGLPDVFADQDGDTNAVQLHDAGFAPVFEVALLVEHAVVRQFLLAIVGERLAIADQRRRVVDVRAGVLGVADHDADPAGFCSHALERGGDLLTQAVVKQQILGRIAAEREFRKQNQIGFESVAGFSRRVDHALRVAGDIADEQIELSERDAERGGHLS